MSDLVRVSGLRVVARNDSGEETEIVGGVSFSIPKGEVLALIGESGSGKTTIALALMGYARSGCRISAGSIHIGDTDVMSLGSQRLSGLRGCQVAYIAQSAAASFNPSKTIMDQVIEGALIHGLMTRAAAEAKAVEMFRSLALPDPQHMGRRYPHQVSGGQLQRLMAAMALITDPVLVILDEPTTALDVTTQIEVLRAFKKVVRERGTTAVYVSHDLAVVAQMADRIVVLNHGEIRETGQTEQILDAPSDPYTKTLTAAATPVVRHASGINIGEEAAASPLLAIDGLLAGYGSRDEHGRPASVVLNDISLTIRRGATLGVIGESGSGKSTLARVIAGLLAPARGTILFNGVPLASRLGQRTREQLRRIQIVFQNADTALNPAHTVARILGRPLDLYHGLRGAALSKRIGHLLDRVRLPTNIAERHCAELSGGQKQRINLARALAAEPDLILCDEVTSALDTVVGAAILDLMAELRRELNVSYLFISHDISTVRAICDEVVVLYAGCKVESGSRHTLSAAPWHPYTDLLVASVPELRRGWLEQVGPSASLPPIGASSRAPRLCSFLQRCPVRIDGVCNITAPSHAVARNGKEILCHHSDEELRRLHDPLPVVVRQAAAEDAT
jgi:oligopeptide/dipeptide ABC transporter ATP-binding protein